MDLRDFAAKLQGIKELTIINGADWDVELGVLTEMLDERRGPALLFDKIKGYPAGYRVMSNVLATPRRMAAAMGFPADTSNVQLIYLLKEKLKSLKNLPPVEVQTGPILENVDEGDRIDMFKFPVPKWHEADGGRYIGTGDMVVTKDLNDGWINVGTYRVEVHDRNTVGLSISPGRHGQIMREAYWAQGKSCPVAVVLGSHPLVWIPAALGLPWGVCEYDMVGSLLGKPLEVIKGAYTGLPVPAEAEIVIEGDCPPPGVEAHTEGPFGEWPGYYASGARTQPVIKVKRVMYRNNPIILGSPPIKPPAGGSGSYMFRAANVWRELDNLGIPGIKGVWNLRSGGSRYWAVASIEQKYAGHAKQVGMAMMCGVEGGFHGRYVVVVDDDIDPSNEEEVMWAMATRCDPGTAIQIIHDYWGTPLDPTISPEKKAVGNITSNRAIFVACRPFHWRQNFPKVNRASDELRKRTVDKWHELFSSPEIAGR